jgi:hypothetical protein
MGGCFEVIVGLWSGGDIIVFADIAENRCGMDEAVAGVATKFCVMAAAPWVVWVTLADRAGIAPIAFCNEVAVSFGIDDCKIAEGGIDELYLGSAAKGRNSGFGR